MINYFNSFELTVIMELECNNRQIILDKTHFHSLPLEPVDPIDVLSGLRRKAFAPAVLTGGDSLKLGD